MIRMCTCRRHAKSNTRNANYFSRRFYILFQICIYLKIYFWSFILWTKKKKDFSGNVGFIFYRDLKDTRILRKLPAISEDNNNRWRQIGERRCNFREEVIATTKEHMEMMLGEMGNRKLGVEDRAMEITRTFLQQRTTRDIQWLSEFCSMFLWRNYVLYLSLNIGKF